MIIEKLRKIDNAKFVWCSLVFLVGLAGRLFFVCFSSFVSGDQADYTAIAMNLVQHRTFAIDSGSPTVFRPPGYPFFIAALYTLLPDSNKAVFIAQSVIGAAAGILIFLLLRRFVTEKVAGFTAMMAAAYPHLNFYAGTILAETILSAVLVLMVYCLYRNDERQSSWLAVLSGITAAAAALISSRFLCAPLIAASCLLLGGDEWRRRLRQSLLCLLASIFFIAPWAVRNNLVFGRLIPSGMNAPGLSFWLASKRIGVYDYSFCTSEKWLREPLMKHFCDLQHNPAAEKSQINERIEVEKDLFLSGLQNIKAEPLRYLADRTHKLPQLWIQPRIYAGHFQSPFTAQNKRLNQMIVDRNYLPALAALTSVTVFTFLPALLVLIGVYLLLPSWRRHRAVFILLITVAVMQAPLFIEHRYTVIIHPLLSIFSAVGFEKILSLRLVREDR